MLIVDEAQHRAIKALASHRGGRGVDDDFCGGATPRRGLEGDIGEGRGDTVQGKAKHSRQGKKVRLDHHARDFLK